MNNQKPGTRNKEPKTMKASEVKAVMEAQHEAWLALGANEKNASGVVCQRTVDPTGNPKRFRHNYMIQVIDQEDQEVS